jgi:A/G-specific adenine glycosylase
MRQPKHKAGPGPPDADVVAGGLLAWYEPDARGLPWRTTRDPYHVLLAEFMLQQTRMEVALPRYRRFLERWPTIQALAAADEEDVLAEWSGLGYYRRARHLHAAAGRIVDGMDGVVPRDPRVLEGLPGVGAYTAGAIASTAYDVPAPAVDGNVLRVIGRVLDRQEPVSTAPYRRAVRDFVRAMMDHGHDPGSVNQALMDLGNKVCRPRNPRCSACPLSKSCLAYQVGDPASLPRRTPKTPLPTEHLVAVVAWRGDRFLVERIKGHGVLDGLWSPPLRRRAPPNSDPLPNVTHTFSHKRWEVTPHVSQRPPSCPRGARWVTLDEFAQLPTSSLAHRLVELAMARRN